MAEEGVILGPVLLLGTTREFSSSGAAARRLVGNRPVVTRSGERPKLESQRESQGTRRVVRIWASCLKCSSNILFSETNPALVAPVISSPENKGMIPGQSSIAELDFVLSTMSEVCVDTQ